MVIIDGTIHEDRYYMIVLHDWILPLHIYIHIKKIKKFKKYIASIARVNNIAFPADDDIVGITREW